MPRSRRGRQEGRAVNGWVIVAWVVAVPGALAAVLWLTTWIEAHFVAPQERAEMVSKALVTHREPQDVEEVAARLAQQALPADWFHTRDASRTPPQVSAS